MTAHSTRTTILAAATNLGFAGVSMIVQVGLFAALARVLTPEDYGIYAFANAVLVYIMHLSQRGLASGLLRRTNLTPEVLGAAYVSCGLIAMAMVGIVAAAAAAVLWISDGTLKLQAQILGFMALPLAVQIVSTPASALMQRHLMMARINVVQIVSVLIGNGLVAIACARAGMGPWSLALGSCAATIAAAIPTMILGRSAVSIRSSRAEIWATLKEGIGFNGIRSLDIAWLQAPSIILGASAPLAAVGVYQRVQFLADLTMQMTVWRVSSVIYAAIAPRQEQRLTAYRAVLTILATLVLPITGFAIATSHDLILVLMGEQWLSGAMTFQILVVAFGLSSLNHAAGMTLEHAGKLRARALAATGGVAVISVLLLTVRHAPPAYYAVPALISMVVVTVLLHALLGERLRDLPAIARSLAPGALLCLATVSGAVMAGQLHEACWQGAPSLVRLSTAFAAASILDLLILPLVCRQPAMQPIIEEFRNSLPRVFAATRFAHRARI